MPRPKQKPPTEGGKILRAELDEILNDSGYCDKNDLSVNFLIEKIVELQDKLNELFEE